MMGSLAYRWHQFMERTAERLSPDTHAARRSNAERMMEKLADEARQLYVSDARIRTAINGSRDGDSKDDYDNNK